MKKQILIAFGALLLTACVHAQQVRISRSNIKEEDNRVTVSFTATLSQLTSNEKLTLTPVLHSASGSRALTPIVIVGRSKAISDQRTDEASDTPNIRYKKAERIPYTTTLPYEAWMSEVSLRVDSKIASCCDEKQLPSYNVISSKLIHYDITPNYPSIKIVKEPTELKKYDNTAAFLYPKSDYALRYETMKNRRVNGTLRVYFKQGSSVINPTYNDNAKVIDQVNKVIDLIQADSTATLDKIVLLGLTSPDGDSKTNAKLATQRAQSLKNYLSRGIKNPNNIFEIIPGSEDWDGLVLLVKASDMPYKQEVLAIIEQYNNPSEREKHLMNLKGGRPYRYMLEHFFPELRNAGYIQIYYDSKSDTTTPTLNRAIDQINAKQYADALETLGTLKETDARASNLRGVAFMMMTRYTEAEAHLKQAVELGSPEAAKNLQEMQTRQCINP